MVAPESVNLIVTSPPYADQRKRQYGSIAPDEYIDWFLPKAEQFQKVLAPDGSFILNIKEKTVGGQRHTYVMNLVMALQRQGWRWVDEYIWHKKNAFPGKWPNRFRDAFERLHHFTIADKFKMRQDAVMVPQSERSKVRARSLRPEDDCDHIPSTGSGMITNWAKSIKRDMVYPSNVLHLGTATPRYRHPAAFPQKLPEWFIKLFTDAGDLVLDPFAGSGTTLAAAELLDRRAIGMDTSIEYCELMGGRFGVKWKGVPA